MKEPMNIYPRAYGCGDRRRDRARIAAWLIAWGWALPCDALAYVDPGTSGMLSQVLYVMFYGALGVFFYMLSYIKQYVAQVKQFLAKHFGHP